MKNIFTLILITISGLALHAQKATSGVPIKDPLFLKEASHDFGKIPQGRPVSYFFEVVNKGTSPLTLERVEASCGCTSPEWSNKPIAPGANSSIKVGFNASAEGVFSKNITIIYNGEQSRVIKISGEVYPSPTTSAPLNPSLSIFKQ